MTRTILLTALLALCSAVWATGTPPPFGGGDATATAVGVGVGIGSGGDGGIGGGGGSSTGGSVNTKAYGAGSTGLTSTAACLGSFGALFNLMSRTYVEPGCVHRYYMDRICGLAEDRRACIYSMTCLDPDLSDDVKAYIGCKPKEE